MEGARRTPAWSYLGAREGELASVETCQIDLLKRGVADWLDMAEVAWVAASVGGAKTEQEIRALAVEVIRRLLQDRLIAVGDVTEDGFRAWDVSDDDALLRIEREWLALGRLPNLGEVCWLSNTEAGDDFARNLPSASQSPGSA